MKFNMSRHATADRIDRLMVIAQSIGWGDEYLSIIHYDHATGRESIRTITTTGVILVKSMEVENKLVTAFVATEAQAQEVFRVNNYSFPDWMRTRVRKNQNILKKKG